MNTTSNYIGLKSAANLKTFFLQFELAVLVYYSWKSLVCIVLLSQLYGSSL